MYYPLDLPPCRARTSPTTIKNNVPINFNHLYQLKKSHSMKNCYRSPSHHNSQQINHSYTNIIFLSISDTSTDQLCSARRKFANHQSSSSSTPNPGQTFDQTAHAHGPHCQLASHTHRSWSPRRTRPSVAFRRTCSARVPETRSRTGWESYLLGSSCGR
jgi:hypothetical protein